MVRDHTAKSKQALTLLEKLKVRPKDSDTSKSLMEGATKKRDELSKLNGAAFDKAYAQCPSSDGLRHFWLFGAEALAHSVAG